MKNFITFNGLNKELYLYDTHCHHKDDHIWVIEAVGEYSCWIKQLKVVIYKSIMLMIFLKIDLFLLIM